MTDNAFQRIAIVGSPGAGKSTLARRIGVATGCAVTHLDREFWQPGWTEPDKPAFRARIAALAETPAWIIDGQYGSSLMRRAERADLIIYLDLPTWRCLWRVTRRVALGYGRVRADMAPGCPERFDLGFMRYVWRFRRDQAPKIEEALAASEATIVRLFSATALDRFSTRVARDGLQAAVTRS